METHGWLAKCQVCYMHKGIGGSLYWLWKGKPLISNTKPSCFSSCFFFCAQILSWSDANLHQDIPAWEQTDRLIPASCLATCQRVHSGICVLKGGKAQAEAWLHLITTFSPTTLKLAFHISLRTQRFPKKGIKRLIYPCIFSLLHRIVYKPNNIFNAVLLKGCGE